MFKPVELVRVNIYVLQRQVSAVSWVLARLGLLHLVDVRQVTSGVTALPSGDVAGLERRYQELKERSKRLMDLLSLPYEPWGLEVEVDPDRDIGAMEDEIRGMEQAIPPLYDQCVRLRDAHRMKTWQHRVLRLLQASGVDLARIRHTQRLLFSVGAVSPPALAALEEALAPFPHLLEPLGDLEHDRVVLVAFLPHHRQPVEEALKTAAFRKAAFPDRDVGDLIREVEKAEGETADQLHLFEDTLQHTAAEAQRPLALLRRKSEVALALLKARERFGQVGHTALISGWVPTGKIAEVQSRVSGTTAGTAYVEVLAPEEMREVKEGTLTIPILFRNPLLLRPFERLTVAYGVPQYRELEPTAFLAASFLLMFGVMFGDVGQGLVLAAAGYGIFRLFYRYTDLGILLMECGSAASIFGLLYGSVFGREDVIPALWFHPMRDLSTSLTVALAIGAGLISVGLLLNIINSLRRHEAIRAIFGERGLMGAFIYWVCLALGSRFLLTGTIGLAGRGLLVFVGLPILAIVFHRPVEEFIRRRKSQRLDWRQMSLLLAESFIGMGDTFISYLANTVSFVRISAFALAHVGLFTAVFALADGLSVLRGGGIWYGLTLILGNVFIILLEGLVASIQAIRLEYYEFFGKFFKGGGELFRPFHV